MKSRNAKNEANKEFQHRPTIQGNKTTGNLPNVKLYDNTMIDQKTGKSPEPSKHMSMMFPWDLYVKLLEYSNNHRTTITDVTIEALKQYLLKTNNSNENVELKERIVELEKNHSGGEQEFEDLEKTIKKISQKDSKNKI